MDPQVIKKLEDLKSLLDKGILDAQEFAELKRKALEEDPSKQTTQQKRYAPEETFLAKLYKTRRQNPPLFLETKFYF